MYRSILLTILLTAIVVMSPSLLFAQNVSVSVSDNSAELRISKTVSQDDFGSTVINLRFIFNDDADAKIFNDNADAKIVSTGLHFVGEPGGIPGFQLIVGGDIYGAYVNVQEPSDDFELLALGIGGGVAYTPVQLGGLRIFANLYYAPKVLTFLDGERLTEFSLGTSYPITPRFECI